MNVEANLFVNVYGMRPFNLTIDLCTLLDGALCPLPTYNFTGEDSITLPASLGISSLLPAIAYKIPDLEAFAQLTLTEASTGKVRACIQSTVSNGWSTHQKSVEWATGAIALLALASAAWLSYSHPESLAPARLLDVMFLFQTVAASALLGLNYPSVYRSYALNFAWALGLFSQSPSFSIQDSINSMRRRTGGTVESSQAGGSAISLVNRKLSPYNNYVIPESLMARFRALPSINLSSHGSRNLTASTLLTSEAFQTPNVLVGGDVATVTTQSSNVLEAGIPIYANLTGIVTENAFMTIFLIALILAGITLAVLGLGYLFLFIIGRTSWGQRRQVIIEKERAGYPAFARAWAFRVALVCAFPVFIFAFYQWTLKDSWAAILLAVLFLLVVLAYVVTPILAILRPRVFSRFTGDIDPARTHTLLPFTASLRQERLYYCVPLFLAVLAKSLVIAFGQGSGMVQAIIILVIEFLLFGVICILKPHRTRGADVLAGYLSIVRIVCTGLLIAFAESLDLDAIPRVVIGIIMAVIFSVTVIVMFFNILVNLGLWRLARRAIPWRRHGVTTDATVLGSQQGRSKSSLEDGKNGSEKESTIAPLDNNVVYARPLNPTPGHTPSTNSPYTPTTNLSRFSEIPSVVSTPTTTSTLGEPLPHRRSFAHSRPPSSSTWTNSAALSPTTTESMYTTPRHSLQPSSPRDEHSSSHP